MRRSTPMALIKTPDARTPQNRADINLKLVNKHKSHRRSHDPLPTDRNGGTSDPINFDNAKASAAPPGWTSKQIGRSQAKWTIEKDDSALNQPSVLKQSGEAPYPVCLTNDTSLKDGFGE